MLDRVDFLGGISVRAGGLASPAIGCGASSESGRSAPDSFVGRASQLFSVFGSNETGGDIKRLVSSEVSGHRGGGSFEVFTGVSNAGTRCSPGSVGAIPDGGGALEARGLLGDGSSSKNSGHGPSVGHSDGDGSGGNGRGHEDSMACDAGQDGTGSLAVGVGSGGSGGEESEREELHNDLCFVLDYNSTNRTRFYTPKNLRPA